MTLSPAVIPERAFLTWFYEGDHVVNHAAITPEAVDESVPVVALGGAKGLGDKVGDMVAMVAENVAAHTLAGCGHFMIEDRPEFVIAQILALRARVTGIQGEERSA